MEYLIRFLARIKPSLSDEDVEDLMRRFSASLTHQSVIIREIEHPFNKKFNRLRGGTEESMMKGVLVISIFPEYQCKLVPKQFTLSIVYID